MDLDEKQRIINDIVESQARIRWRDAVNRLVEKSEDLSSITIEAVQNELDENTS